MSDIQRYDIGRNFYGNDYELQESHDGDVVRYEDHERHLKELDNQLDCATEFCRQYQIENKAFSLEVKQLKERVKELESKLDEAKKESAMYWNQVILLNEKLAALGLDEEFEDVEAIKENK